MIKIIFSVCFVIFPLLHAEDKSTLLEYSIKFLKDKSNHLVLPRLTKQTILMLGSMNDSKAVYMLVDLASFRALKAGVLDNEELKSIPLPGNYKDYDREDVVLIALLAASEENALKALDYIFTLEECTLEQLTLVAKVIKENVKSYPDLLDRLLSDSNYAANKSRIQYMQNLIPSVNVSEFEKIWARKLAEPKQQSWKNVGSIKTSNSEFDTDVKLKK